MADHVRPPNLPARRDPFVGRERELARLRAHLSAVRAGTGGVALIAGEPGIGKTRLLAAVAAQARATGTLVLVGHAYDATGLPPYVPFVEVLRRYVRSGEPDLLPAQRGTTAAHLALLLPDLHDRLPDLPRGRVDAPELDRFGLFEAVVEVLFAAAQRAAGGALLVLEDLHWADAATLDLVQHLVRRLDEAPLLLAISYRTVDVPSPHPLPAVLAELSRLPTVERLQLQPLPAAETATLIADLLAAPAALEVAGRVYAETEGNPFFITELVRQLQGEGLDLTTPAAVGIGWTMPEGVRQVIAQRLARLAQPTTELLQDAAVLGERFSFELLVAMAGGDETGLLPAFEAGLTAGMVQERGEGYEFTHALIRQTIVEGLSGPRRQRLHLRAAAAIEQVYGRNLAPHVAALAGHYRAAGAAADPDTTIGYLLRAGETAEQAFAYAEAEAHWQAAFALLTAQGAAAQRRADVLLRLGRLLVGIGFDRYPAAVAHVEQALGLYTGAGEGTLAAAAHARLGILLASNGYVGQDVPRALDHLLTAEAVLRDGPVTAALGAVYQGLCNAYLSAVRTAEGVQAAARTVAIARAIDDDDMGTYGTFIQARHLVGCGRLRDGWAAHEQAWAGVSRRGHPRATNFAGYAGLDAAWLDDPAGALSRYEREGQRRQNQSVWGRRLRAQRASAYARMGDLPAAERLLAEPGALGFYQLVEMLGETVVAFYAGDWDAVAETWAAVRERHRRAGYRDGQADFGLWLAHLYALREEREPAEALLEETVAIAVAGSHLLYELRARVQLAVVAAERGDLPAAQAHAARCRAVLAGGEDWRGLAGRVALADAVVAAAAGDAATAAERFARAQQTFQRYTLPWEEAEVRYQWGRALHRAGQAEAGATQLAAATAVYRQHGAGDRWVQRVRAAAQAPVPRRPAASSARPVYPAGLTVREVEVLRLVAAGKTNQEIADALVISLRTAVFHVTNILGKTGSANRTEAAAYAHRHQLLRDRR